MLIKIKCVLIFLLVFAQPRLTANATHRAFEQLSKAHKTTWNSIPKGTQVAILKLVCKDELPASKPDPFETLFNYMYEENPYKKSTNYHLFQ